MPNNNQLIATHVGSPFFVPMKLCFVSALFINIPIILTFSLYSPGAMLLILKNPFHLYVLCKMAFVFEELSRQGFYKAPPGCGYNQPGHILQFSVWFHGLLVS